MVKVPANNTDRVLSSMGSKEMVQELLSQRNNLVRVEIDVDKFTINTRDSGNH